MAGLDLHVTTKYESRKELSEDDGLTVIEYLNGLPDTPREEGEGWPTPRLASGRRKHGD